MAFGSFNNIALRGIVSAVPKQIKKQEDYYETFGQEAVDKIKDMTGIYQRAVAYPHQTTGDLSYIAAKELMKKLDWKPETIDALILVTQTPDYQTPSTACILQHKLGLSNDCMAFDINLGCSAYVYGLYVAGSMLQNQNMKRIILLSGDTVNDMINPKDRSTALLFGDASSATAIEKTDNSNNMDYVLRTNGEGYDCLIVKNKGSRNKNKENLSLEDDYLFMDGTQVFNFTLTDVSRTLKDFKAKFEIESEDIDYLILHQANLFILKSLSKKIKVDMSKVPITIDRFGNTSAASIPLTMTERFKGNTDYKDKSILISGFGVGLSWGAFFIRPTYDIYFDTIYTDYIGI